MANLAALRAVVFSLSAKNLTGVEITPPADATVKPPKLVRGPKGIALYSKEHKARSGL